MLNFNVRNNNWRKYSTHSSHNELEEAFTIKHGLTQLVEVTTRILDNSYLLKITAVNIPFTISRQVCHNNAPTGKNFVTLWEVLEGGLFLIQNQ